MRNVPGLKGLVRSMAVAAHHDSDHPVGQQVVHSRKGTKEISLAYVRPTLITSILPRDCTERKATMFN